MQQKPRPTPKTGERLWSSYYKTGIDSFTNWQFYYVILELTTFLSETHHFSSRVDSESSPAYLRRTFSLNRANNLEGKK